MIAKVSLAMKHLTKLLVATTVVLPSAAAHATPSTTMWAPSTASVQGYGVLHLGDDTYFADDGLYPVDLGLTMGILPWHELQAELGIDLVYPTIDATGTTPEGLAVPIYFNAKLGTPEDSFFEHQPGVGLGVYNVGVEKDVTTYHVLYAMIGKTLPHVGTLSVGGYYGLDDKLLVDPDGDAAQAGVMVGWGSPAIAVPKLDHLAIAADLQTGHNALGAVGAGVGIYFTPAIALLTGPVYFLEQALQPGGNQWMWSAQIDIDVDLGLASGE